MRYINLRFTLLTLLYGSGTASHNFGDFLRGQRTNFGGRCLRYYAYRKMLAAKMVFVSFFFWGKAQMWGQHALLAYVTVYTFVFSCMISYIKRHQTWTGHCVRFRRDRKWLLNERRASWWPFYFRFRVRRPYISKTMGRATSKAGRSRISHGGSVSSCWSKGWGWLSRYALIHEFW